MSRIRANPVSPELGLSNPPDGNHPKVVEKTINRIMASQKSGME